MSATGFLPIIKPLESQRSIRIRWDSFQRYTPLKRLSDYVSKHAEDNLKLGDAADIAGLSRIYFAHYFRQKTGVTFKYWMDFLRVARAVKLLENSDLQIVEIAETCGFEDATTFTRTFRRILNRTPIQCRREGGFAVRSVRPEQTPKDS